MLETADLTKSWGSLVAVDDVSLTFDADDPMTFVVGPNGAGKTTLVNLLTGLYKPDSGRITLDGERIEDVTPADRIPKGLIRSFQIAQLFEDMTTEENLRTAVLSRRDLTRSPRMFDDSNESVEAEVSALCQRFDLQDVRDAEVSTLSHGDRKIIDVAMAMAMEPEVLLLDEPTAGVQAQNKENLVRRIVEVAREEDVITVTIEHDMDLVSEHADRLVALHQGAVYHDGAPSAIENDTELRQILLGVE